MQPSRSFATDRKPRTMIMPPGSLSGRNFQPSFHSGMEAAYVGHPANPFQNRPALSSGRDIDVKAPVRRRCCMPQDVGIRPLDDVIHMQAVGRGSKGEFVDSDPIHLRIGPHEGDASEKKQNASASRLLIFARIGIGAYFSSCTRCSACF